MPPERSPQSVGRSVKDAADASSDMRKQLVPKATASTPEPMAAQKLTVSAVMKRTVTAKKVTNDFVIPSTSILQRAQLNRPTSAMAFRSSNPLPRPASVGADTHPSTRPSSALLETGPRVEQRGVHKSPSPGVTDTPSRQRVVASTAAIATPTSVPILADKETREAVQQLMRAATPEVELDTPERSPSRTLKIRTPVEYDPLYGEAIRHGDVEHPFLNKFFSFRGHYNHHWREGLGFLSLRDGSSYCGQFLHGEIEGAGVHCFPDGTRYEGEFQRGEFHGRGRILCPSGESYDGEFRFGIRHGQATQRFYYEEFEGLPRDILEKHRTPFTCAQDIPPASTMCVADGEGDGKIRGDKLNRSGKPTSTRTPLVSFGEVEPPAPATGKPTTPPPPTSASVVTPTPVAPSGDCWSPFDVSPSKNQGKLHPASKWAIYRGGFVDHKMEGPGHLTVGGCTFDGQFQQNHLEGRCEATYAASGSRGGSSSALSPRHSRLNALLRRSVVSPLSPESWQGRPLPSASDSDRDWVKGEFHADVPQGVCQFYSATTGVLYKGLMVQGKRVVFPNGVGCLGWRVKAAAQTRTTTTGTSSLESSQLPAPVPDRGKMVPADQPLAIVRALSLDFNNAQGFPNPAKPHERLQNPLLGLDSEFQPQGKGGAGAGIFGGGTAPMVLPYGCFDAQLVLQLATLKDIDIDRPVTKEKNAGRGMSLFPTAAGGGLSGGGRARDRRPSQTGQGLTLGRGFAPTGTPLSPATPSLAPLNLNASALGDSSPSLPIPKNVSRLHDDDGWIVEVRLFRRTPTIAAQTLLDQSMSTSPSPSMSRHASLLIGSEAPSPTPSSVAQAGESVPLSEGIGPLGHAVPLLDLGAVQISPSEQASLTKLYQAQLSMTAQAAASPKSKTLASPQTQVRSPSGVDTRRRSTGARTPTVGADPSAAVMDPQLRSVALPPQLMALKVGARTTDGVVEIPICPSYLAEPGDYVLMVSPSNVVAEVPGCAETRTCNPPVRELLIPLRIVAFGDTNTAAASASASGTDPGVLSSGSVEDSNEKSVICLCGGLAE